MTPPPPVWTIVSLLRWTTQYFADKGVLEPRASAEILLAHTLGLSRLDLYLRHDQPLSREELARFKALIVRRRLGEPVAYLTGHKEFWSLDFLVSPAVLIPRPETEVLVEAVLAEFSRGPQGPPAAEKPGPPAPHPASETPPSSHNLGNAGCQPLKPEVEARLSHPPLALDVGVGSGAVAVALAKELPELFWLAVDVSAAALEVARENARRHGVASRIVFFQGDLLTALRPGPHFVLLVANLPYVPRPEWEKLPPEIRDYEPSAALVGGEDGLALIRPLTQEAHNYLVPGGFLALEVGAGQADRVAALLSLTKAYDTLKIIPDYQRLPRVVLARRQTSP